MEQSKKEFLPILQGVKLSKTQSQTTAEKYRENESHSLCLNHRFYKVCHVVYLAMSFARGYNSDPGLDHWTVVKLSLVTLNRTKEMFLGYGGDKEFVVKSYVDASFDTDLDDSES